MKLYQQQIKTLLEEQLEFSFEMSLEDVEEWHGYSLENNPYYEDLGIKIDGWHFWFEKANSDNEELLWVNFNNGELFGYQCLYNERWIEDESHDDPEKFIDHSKDWRDLAIIQANYAVTCIREKLEEIEALQPQLKLPLDGKKK